MKVMTQLHQLCEMTGRDVESIESYVKRHASKRIAERLIEVCASNEASFELCSTGVDVHSHRGYIWTVGFADHKPTTETTEEKLDVVRSVDVLQNHVDKLNPNSEAAQEIEQVIAFLKAQK